MRVVQSEITEAYVLSDHRKVLTAAEKSDPKTIDIGDFEQWVTELAKAIDAPAGLLPTYGRTEDFARPHIEKSKHGFAYVIVERGKELLRVESSNPMEILAATFLDITAVIASDWERRHRAPAEDHRRRFFAKQLSLLNYLHPPWADRKMKELGDLLIEVNLNPSDVEAVVSEAEGRSAPTKAAKKRNWWVIYNVKKKITKDADRLGFVEDEYVIAAGMTFPLGHKRKTALRMGLGSVALTNHDAPASAGLAAKMQGGRHFLALTNRRLLATTVTVWTTNPKSLVAEWPVDQLRSIAVEPGFMAATINVQFKDGSEFWLDGMRLSGAEYLDGALTI